MVSHLNLFIFSLLLIGVTCAPTDEQFKLIVLHNNDMHARFEQTNSQAGKCSDKLNSQNNCFGGFPRVAYIVNEAKKNEENVIFLNAGDTYQGTVWYTIHKWPIVAQFIQLIGLDAMSLGNHEFDDGVEGLEPFLANITVPVVGANLEFTNERSLAPYIKPSTILNVGGKQIGVIGYLTPETRDIANPGKVIFKDEVKTIRAEAKRLTAQGIDILIAVGHSGYGMDQKIAREVENIDLVIGGHTNTFLYTGDQIPSDEPPAGLYPTLVNQKSGRKVPVVTAYAYTKYMGRVELTFDKKGEMTHYQGNPILLDRTVPQDAKVLAALQPWKASLTDKLKLEMGKTRVFLDGQQSSCRMRECNLGNLITDAFVHYNAWLVTGQQSGWTDAAISIINGGGVRASIDETANNGTVTMEDVLAVLPFENGVVNLKLQGKYLKEALEVSVAYYDRSGLEAPGKYLQVSGLQVEYDLDKPAGKRVLNALVRCADCRVPTFEPIDDEKLYGILLTTFVADGGDGYKVIKDHAQERNILDATESDILAEYFKKKSPVAAGLERRTILYNSSTAVQASLGFVLAALIFSKILTI